MQRMIPDHEPVIGQPAKCFRLLRDRDPLCAFNRHQRGKEMGNRTRATDPRQKGWNRNDPFTPYRRCKESPVVPDNELQVLDYIVFNNDLKPGVAFDLCDGAYYYISTRHTTDRYRTGPGTSSTSVRRTAPSSGIPVPSRQPVSPRRAFSPLCHNRNDSSTIGFFRLSAHQQIDSGLLRVYLYRRKHLPPPRILHSLVCVGPLSLANQMK